MSFLKITDPSKCEAMIKDYLETRKRIKSNMIAKKVREMETQSELTKFFKPITETQKATAKEITEGLKAIKEGIEKIPGAIMFPAFPSIDISEEDILKLGPVATKALRKFLRKGEPDQTFGIRDEDGKFYIGGKQVDIKDNNIIVGDKEYEGTPGLWDLIVSQKPNEEIIMRKDLENYENLMHKTNSLYKNNDPTQKRPKGNYRGDAWEKVKKFWANREKYTGSGIVVIPSDPNALLERLDLLLAGQEAWDTGVRNELVSICDELKRQGVINANEYKKLNSIIKK